MKVMNKSDVYKTITATLLKRYENAKWAANQAHEAATNEESIAENKYDTFGLEASYLAHGQSQRVVECEKDWLVFHKKQLVEFTEEDSVDLWSLVRLSNFDSASEVNRYFFVSPCSGGLNIIINDETVYLVTPFSPVGKLLLGKMVGDELKLPKNGEQTAYEITSIA